MTDPDPDPGLLDETTTHTEPVGCCTCCNGRGSDHGCAGTCWECYGTGHLHLSDVTCTT